MNGTLCQVPDQPCVYRSKEQFASLRLLPCAGYIFQYACNLRCAEIGIWNQPCPLPDRPVEAVPLEFLDHVRRSAALPYNRVIDRLSGLPVPEYRRLSLVRNADARNVLMRRPDHRHTFCRNRKLARPYLHRVVFHPARLGIDLRKFLLGHGADVPRFIKQNTAGACRPLIQCHHIFLHTDTSPYL